MYTLLIAETLAPTTPPAGGSQAPPTAGGSQAPPTAGGGSQAPPTAGGSQAPPAGGSQAEAQAFDITNTTNLTYVVAVVVGALALIVGITCLVIWRRRSLPTFEELVRAEREKANYGDNSQYNGTQKSDASAYNNTQKSDASAYNNTQKSDSSAYNNTQKSDASAYNYTQKSTTSSQASVA